MTNRDKFNKMSNAELADILGRTLGADTCKFCCYAKEKCLGKSCTEGIEKWLNASCEPENPPADKVDKPQQEHLPRETLIRPLRTCERRSGTLIDKFKDWSE